MTTQTTSVLFLSKLSRPTKENQLSHPTFELTPPSVAMMMMMMETKAYYSSHCVLHSKMVAMSVWASARKRHQPNSQLRSLLVSDGRQRCPCHPGQARGAPRGRGGRSPQPQHGHNANMEGTTPQLPPAGLGPALAPPAPLRPTRNFRGRRSGRPGRGVRGGRVSPARTRGRSGYFLAGQLRHLGATLRERPGRQPPPPRSSSAPPGPGALKLQSGGGGGAACPGVTEAPRGRRSGRRAERGKGRVVGGAGRAGPPHKGRSPAAPCGHSPAAAAPCRCRSARRWAGSCG